MKKSGSTKGKDPLEDENVRLLIAERAYYKSENDGFPIGNDHHYWIEAEKEVLAELTPSSNGESKKAVPKNKPSK